MLGWHFVSMSSTAYVQYPSQQTGYNVYAPVAYFLTGSGESIRVARHNDFNRGVLVRARENGYQIWITVQQFGAALPAELFANPQRQSALINDLIQKALSDGAHGINIDFENMGLSNRDGFSRFMQELYPKARQHGLIISVDVTRPGTSSWAACYDHGALAQACDYLVLMAYDQYYAGSPVEGPVASLIWTESAITSVLSRGVPPGKLILGVPFYSRNWIIEQETITAGVDSVLVTVETANLRAQPSTASALLGQAQRNTLLPYQATVSGAAVDGDTNWYAVGYNQGTAYLSATLSRFLAAGETASAASRVAGSFALGLQHTLAMQNNYNPETRTSFYDTSAGRRDMFEVVMVDDAGLTLLTYRNQGGVLNKIWLENYDSLRQRYRLVEKYGLAGAAAWSLEWQNHVRSPWLEMMQ
jgi:spore germination protein YaaH